MFECSGHPGIMLIMCPRPHQEKTAEADESRLFLTRKVAG